MRAEIKDGCAGQRSTERDGRELAIKAAEIRGNKQANNA